MPSYIDPAWEYWVGDEEVTELLAETGACVGPYDSVIDWRLDKHASLGLRFGRGNPDNFNCYLAPEKFDERIEVLPRDCAKCGTTFTPDRHSRLYCSVECRPRRGREREIPLEATCPQCGEIFEPKSWEHAYCSLTCVGASKRREGFETGCKACGKELPASKSPNGRERIYCSDACKHVWKQRETRRRKREKKTAG